MTLSLRPYQRAAIEALYDYFGANTGNPLVVIPTAGGKSVVIAGFIREAIAAYADTRVLVLTHVRELIQQNFQALLRAWPDAPAGIYSAGLSRRDIHAQILFAGIQSIHRHAYKVRVMAGEQAALLFTSPPYGSQRNYTTGGIGDWDMLMRGVFQHADDALADDGQILVNLGLTHRDNEWHPYWQGWIEWMRTIRWRRFGWYVWDQGPGLPGDWNGRLAPSFEFLFHFNRQARQANKIVPCKWAGDPLLMSGLRRADGTMSGNSHEGRPIQDFRIPDNVVRITRHKERGIETEHPAVFPVKLPAFLMETYANAGDLVFEPFCGSGTTLLAGQRTGRHVRAIELAPAYVDLAIARWRQNHPDLPVTLDGDGRDYDAIAAERTKVMEAANAA